MYKKNKIHQRWMKIQPTLSQYRQNVNQSGINSFGALIKMYSKFNTQETFLTEKPHY